jgi:hypothetical protein
MMDTHEIIKKYKGKSTYQIVVRGKVDPNYMMQINALEVMHTDIRGETASTLTGVMEDQEALSGLLNILVDHQYEVISVLQIDK